MIHELIKIQTLLQVLKNHTNVNGSSHDTIRIFSFLSKSLSLTKTPFSCQLCQCKEIRISKYSGFYWNSLSIPIFKCKSSARITSTMHLLSVSSNLTRWINGSFLILLNFKEKHWKLHHNLFLQCVSTEPATECFVPKVCSGCSEQSNTKNTIKTEGKVENRNNVSWIQLCRV